jgi:hypothetical protein
MHVNFHKGLELNVIPAREVRPMLKCKAFYRLDQYLKAYENTTN